MFSSGTNTDVVHLHTHKVLNELDVVLRLLRQLVPLRQSRRRGSPSRESLVNRLCGGQDIEVGRETWELFAINLVGHCNLKFLQPVENVKLGHVQAGVVVHGGGVLQNDKVEPTAAALAASGDTPFATDGLEVLSDFLCGVSVLGLGSSAVTHIQLLSGEGSRADSGGVRLHDTDDVLELERRNGKAGDNTSDAGVGASNVGIRAVVNVKHERVCALHKDLLVGLEGSIHEENGIDNVGS
jgi:hypothetical protein